MLEPNFQLPDPEVAARETQKRVALLEWFAEYIKPSVTGLLVSGSLSYGQNYSVKPTSDIDMQLLINHEGVKELLKTDCFNPDGLAKAVNGYTQGLYEQFSLVFTKDEVPMECHFWDEQAFTDAITFKAESTKRLRSSIDTPSTDYGYSFDREGSVTDYFGEMIDGYAVSDFPSYRRIDGKLFLCRPVTNVLGLPLVVIDNAKLRDATDACWTHTAQELIAFAGSEPVDLNIHNIANTLPGKNKMSPEALQKVHDRTASILRALRNSEAFNSN